jgi:hypothetical protein
MLATSFSSLALCNGDRKSITDSGPSGSEMSMGKDGFFEKDGCIAPVPDGSITPAVINARSQELLSGKLSLIGSSFSKS